MEGVKIIRGCVFFRFFFRYSTVIGFSSLGKLSVEIFIVIFSSEYIFVDITTVNVRIKRIKTLIFIIVIVC